MEGKKPKLEVDLGMRQWIISNGVYYRWFRQIEASRVRSLGKKSVCFFSPSLFGFLSTSRLCNSVAIFSSMAVRATVSRFPTDPDAQEASGLPWGVTVSPFSPVDELGNPPVSGSNGNLLGNPPVSGSNGNLVPRCDNCWAYFNSYCELEQWVGTCSLYGTLNGLTSETIARYSQPELCAETCSSFIDLELPDDGEEAVKAWPVYVAAVDLASSEEFLELIKSALLAALEALGPGSLFGLVTFSHKIGLYDVQGPIPVVKNVFIPPRYRCFIAL
ncbi:protein transport protein SEC23 D-like [Aristolochia californica]|uniref:protein transport protein SEC23 D-like n=1 Tax=Aristolochia californica TaxID=171875 RepID=UPI0035DEB5B4